MKLNDLVENDKVRHYFLFAMFLMAFLLRLGFTYQEYSQNGTQGWVDAKVYLANGISFSEGDYYPQTDGYMQVGPAIPVIVALSNLIFSDPIWPVLVLNCLISALLVFILYELGKTVISKIAGILLASWSVFNFSFIRLNHQILKEPYLIALIPLITLLMIYVYQNKNTMRNIVLSSLLFSALIHTDERFIVYGPLIFIAILLCRKVKRRFLYAVLWGTVLLCSMVPWTVRNFNEFGELVILTPRTTAITSKLWGKELTSQHFLEDQYAARLEEARVEGTQLAAEDAGVELREHGKYEKYYMAFYHYWKPVYFRTNFIQYGLRPVKWSLSHNINGIMFYGIFFPFFLLGIIYAFMKRNFLIIALSSIPIIHSLLHTLMVWPIERYRIPMNVYVVLVALWFIDSYCFSSVDRKICGYRLRMADRDNHPSDNKACPEKTHNNYSQTLLLLFIASTLLNKIIATESYPIFYAGF